MKNLFLIVIVLVIGFVSKAQTPFTTPNLLTGGSTKITQNKGAGQFDSGLVVTPRFTDTATANLSVVSLYGGMLIRVLDTLWMRNADATAWNKMGGTIGGGGGGGSQTWQQTLTTGSTLTQNNTIAGGNFDLKFNNTDFYVGNLGGDNEKVVWTDNDGLLYRTTFPILSDSLNPYITGLQNGVISGCTVTWIANYDYEVSPCTYRIAGTVYNIPTSTSITLSAADPTNDRIDVFYVNTSSVAAVAQGTPANPAEEPDIDVSTQLKISFAVVEAATTQPTLDIDVIYKENAGPPTEWTYSDNTANLDPASTNNPYEGTFDIEGTSVASGNQFTMTVSPTPVFTDYVFLNFKIRSKATWAAGRVMAIQFFNGVTPLGSVVVFGQGTYGFQSSITASYQNISIPLSDFGNITGATSIRFLRNGTNTIGFYIDNILLLEARSYVVPYVDQVVGISPITVNQVGSLAEVSLNTNGVTDAYLRQSAGLSVIGNSTNATANVADITAGTDHYVLRRSGTSLGFGLLNAAAMNATYSNGQYLTTDGSGGLSWGSPAGGITSLNLLTAATQTFATGTSGTDFNISSATSTHTFNIPDASASARGLITTGGQTIAGDKVLTGNNTYTGSNTFNGSLFFRGLTNGTATDSLVTIKDHQVFKLNLQNQSPWVRQALSGAASTTNIVQTRTIADTIVTGGTDVTGGGTSPLFSSNHSGNMGIFRNSIGVTTTDGLVLGNYTAAAAGAQQWAPRLRWRAYGWKTNATAASQSVDAWMELQSVQGTAAPTGSLAWYYSINGAAATNPMVLTSAGKLQVVGATVGNIETVYMGLGSASAVNTSGLTITGSITTFTSAINSSFARSSASLGSITAHNFQHNLASTSPSNTGNHIATENYMLAGATYTTLPASITATKSRVRYGSSSFTAGIALPLIVGTESNIELNANASGQTVTEARNFYATLSALSAPTGKIVTYKAIQVDSAQQAYYSGTAYGIDIRGSNYINNIGGKTRFGDATATAPTESLEVKGNAKVEGRFLGAKGADVASANDLTLGSDGNLFTITGATQINAITTASWTAGSVIYLFFSSTPTVKNNTAGGAGTATMLLAGGVDFVASANDILTLIYNGTNWVEVARSVN